MRTLVICTGQPIVDEGIRKVLDDAGHISVVATCATAQAAREAVMGTKPDFLIYGLRPDPEFLSQVHAMVPGMILVLWGADESTDIAHYAVELGVRGFLSTSSTPEMLLECLRMAGQGETWMERALSVSMLYARPPKLTRRQADMVRLLTQGLKNKEIASRLGISEATVKSYFTVLFDKVGAKDRFELALFGLKNLNSLGPVTPKAPATGQVRSTKRPVS